MKRQTLKLTCIEVGIAISLLAILTALLLPALARSREAGRRASCANNLKQLGLALKMYANEWRGKFPPCSPIPNNWIVDAKAIYPEYMSDLAPFVCPSSPFADPNTFKLRDNREHPGAQVGAFHPDCLSSLFYIYTGYMVLWDEQALGLFNASFDRLPQTGWNRNARVYVPVWADSDRPENSYPTGQANTPIMWDRVPIDERDFSHIPFGGNVLHMDGHTEFVRYSYYNKSNFFPMTRISAETFGSVLPFLSRDCYGP